MSHRMILGVNLLFYLVQLDFFSSHYAVKAVSIYTNHRALCNKSVRVNLINEVENKT